MFNVSGRPFGLPVQVDGIAGIFYAVLEVAKDDVIEDIDALIDGLKGIDREALKGIDAGILRGNC